MHLGHFSLWLFAIINFTVESPAGVGFSYSTDPGVDYVTNDDQTATDNYNFLVQFFSYYPEFKQNDFYIT